MLRLLIVWCGCKRKKKLECWCSVRWVCLVFGLVFVCLLVCGLFVEVSVLGASVSPPKENTWVSIASMAYPRSYFGTVVDGIIYAIGGLDARSPWWVTGVVERYDPSANTWRIMSSLPTPRYGCVAVCSMGKIYCIGGSKTSSGDYSGANEVYDPATNQWERKASMPTPRIGASACVVDGCIYVMGGRVATGPGVLDLPVCEVYDPLEDAWSVYEEGWPYVSSVSVVFDNKEYVCDGVGLRIHDLVLDSWVDGVNVPLGLHGRGIAEVDGLLYVLGGCTETYGYYFGIIMPEAIFVERVHSGRVFVYTPFGYGRVAPEISVLSLEEGGRYDFGTPVSLEFSLSQPVVWLGYCLDGQANVTIRGNVTLSGLSSGLHSVRVFAEDKYGNIGASETLAFSVVDSVNASMSMSFIIAVVTIVVVAVVVCGGLLLFLKKRRCIKSLQMS